MEFTITSENNLSLLIDELNHMLDKARIDDESNIDCDAIENAIDAMDQEYFDMKGDRNFLPFKIDLEKNTVIFAALQSAVERLDWQA
jgi:hypothetical protein